MMVELSVTNPVLSPIAVDAKAAAAMFGVSSRTWRRYNSSGQCPTPVKLGGSTVRWRVQELIEWSDHGCPSRVVWDRLRTIHPVPLS